MNMEDFLNENIEKRENKNFISTEFEYVEVSDDKRSRYQCGIEGAIRCYSKKADLYTFLMDEIELHEVISPEISDFDEAISQLSDSISSSEVEEFKYPDWQRGIFFLPSYWEKKIAGIIQNNMRDLDCQLRRYIPEKVAVDLGLHFNEESLIKKEVLNKEVSNYSTSFFKVFDENHQEIFDCATLEKAFCNINKELGGIFIDSYYCVGSISGEYGLFLPSTHYKIHDPKTMHYSFWKLETSPDFCRISLNFEERSIVGYV